MTLATNGPLGLWAAAVFYMNDGFRLYFLSAGHTRHAQNMAHTPHVAGTIQEDYAQWEKIKGMQFEGEIMRLSGTARIKAITAYGKKYLFVTKKIPTIQKALSKVNWYALDLTQLYLIDNSKGFGHRDEIPLTQPRHQGL
ncbi:MAG: pyridoxamine 5'-phosphate oxidase [Chloroflexi bacterium]|nr:MAG: pyridoxamine 5'-phosphate oxidase [Chloroflexota bacterium]